MSNPKEYLNRVSSILSEQETLSQDMKSVKDEMKENLGKEMSDKIIKLAKLIQKEKLGQYLSEAEEIDALNKEIYG